MGQKKPRGYGYVHVEVTHPKRPGRHAKNRGKRLSKIKKYRGQGH